MYCYGNINEFNAKYNVLNIEPTKEKITDLNNIDEIVKKLTDTNKINKKYSEELTPEIEEATKVITAGKYTLQYGRYTNDFVDITINADNTCHFKDTDYKISDAEEIIRWITIFEDKDILETKVRKEYPKLNEFRLYFRNKTIFRN